MAYKPKLLTLAESGTGAALTASNGGILYSNASTAAILSGTATAGQVLRSGASTIPSWSTATYPATAGSSGNVLTSDGTNWTSSSTQKTKLVLIQRQVLSGASVAFTSNLNNTYGAYMVSIYGTVATSGNPDMYLDFSSNGGSSYFASGMATGINYSAYNTATLTNANSTSTGIICKGLPNNSTYNATFYIYNIGVAISCWYNGQCTWYDGTNLNFGTIMGSTGSNTSVNAIRFSTSASTFADGSAAIYGIAYT